MIKMVKGCQVPFPEKLQEQYEFLSDNCLIANIGADKIGEVMRQFIRTHEEPLFFILELPTNKEDEEKLASDGIRTLHKDVYYMDGCSCQKAEDMLSAYGELLIHDGLCQFGFGGHISHDEIMAGKYNVVTLYSRTADTLTPILESHGLTRVNGLLTAWDTFTRETPGECFKYEADDGRDVYSIIEELKSQGLFFAERRRD